MHTQKYSTLSRASGTIGDAFYDCVTAWVQRPLDNKQRNICLEKGHEYEAALLEQIQYLRGLHATARTREALRTCEFYYSALQSQLRLLEKAFSGDN